MAMCMDISKEGKKKQLMYLPRTLNGNIGNVQLFSFLHITSRFDDDKISQERLDAIGNTFVPTTLPLPVSSLRRRLPPRPRLMRQLAPNADGLAQTPMSQTPSIFILQDDYKKGNSVCTPTRAGRRPQLLILQRRISEWISGLVKQKKTLRPPLG